MLLGFSFRHNQLPLYNTSVIDIEQHLSKTVGKLNNFSEASKVEERNLEKPPLIGRHVMVKLDLRIEEVFLNLSHQRLYTLKLHTKKRKENA